MTLLRALATGPAIRAALATGPAIRAALATGPAIRAALALVLPLGPLAVLGCEGQTLDFRSPTDVGISDAEGGASSAERSEPAPSDPPDAPPARELVVNGELDLTAVRTDGGDCADGGDIVSYRVEQTKGASVMLAKAPSTGCLAVGDEVLLIELQAAASATEHVGNAELLRVQSLENAVVELVSSPLLGYGTTSADGFDARGSVVMLQRVPRFTRLTVREAATLTAASWDGPGTGVLALRVLGDLLVDGAISMSGHGFRGGAERPEALAHGLQGESLIGPGGESTAANLGGGGGGLGDQEQAACVQDGNAGGGGGHLEAGGDATVDDLCDGEGRGRGGEPYAAAGRLFLGSGGGSGGMDNVADDNPPGAAGGHGGGIVWLLAQSVSGSGRIDARGLDGKGDLEDVECQRGVSVTECYDHSGPGGGGAGGTIRLTTTTLSNVTLDVTGGGGGNGYDPAGGNGGDGSPGVVDAPEG